MTKKSRFLQTPIEPFAVEAGLTADEILVEARCQQVATMEEIQWAVLETNGQISIIPKKSSS